MFWLSKKWQAVKVPTVDLALLLEPRLRQPHLVVEGKTLSQLCSWNTKLCEVRGVAVDGIVCGKLKIGEVVSAQIAAPPGGLLQLVETVTEDGTSLDDKPESLPGPVPTQLFELEGEGEPGVGTEAAGSKGG